MSYYFPHFCTWSNQRISIPQLYHYTISIPQLYHYTISIPYLYHIYTISIPSMFTSISVWFLEHLSTGQAKRKAQLAPSLGQVVSLIREVYKRRNPAKLGEVRDLVAKYKAPGVWDPPGWVPGSTTDLNGVDLKPFETIWNLNTLRISMRNDIG